MSLPTIPEGLTVKYIHRREVEPIEKASIRHPHPTVAPRGGITTAFLSDADGRQVAQGVAVCHEKDNYNKRIGRAISLGRALKAYREQAVQPLVRHGDGVRTGETA
jgi:hypothetical protein